MYTHRLVGPLGPCQSTCRWLPASNHHTDDRKKGKLAGFARWASVKERLGHLMTPRDHYPPRWRVDRFPPDGLLAELVKEDPWEAM